MEQIAREVEENEAVVQEICEIAEEFFPEYPGIEANQSIAKNKLPNPF